MAEHVRHYPGVSSRHLMVSQSSPFHPKMFTSHVSCERLMAGNAAKDEAFKRWIGESWFMNLEVGFIFLLRK
jgi:hypothetical protein